MLKMFALIRKFFKSRNIKMTFNFGKYVKNGKRAHENFKFRNYKEFQDYKKMWAVRFIF